MDFCEDTFFAVAAYAHALYIPSMKIPSRLRLLAFNSWLDSQVVTRRFCVTRISFSFTRNFSFAFTRDSDSQLQLTTCNFYFVVRLLRLKINNKLYIEAAVFYKKGLLKNFAKFIGRQLCQSLFFNKFANNKQEECSFIKKETPPLVLSCEFCNSRTSIL